MFRQNCDVNSGLGDSEIDRLGHNNDFSEATEDKGTCYTDLLSFDVIILQEEALNF